jgi:seryl-tRNA(Sec) selenium transferase
VDSSEPFTKAEAKRVAMRLLAAGAIRFSGHARDEMKHDGIIEADVVNAFCHGAAHRAAMQSDGSYSYKFTRRDVGVAVSFRLNGATAVAVVVRTAWRIRRAP